jgi:hypothetical protein
MIGARMAQRHPVVHAARKILCQTIDHLARFVSTARLPSAGVRAMA